MAELSSENVTRPQGPYSSVRRPPARPGRCVLRESATNLRSHAEFSLSDAPATLLAFLATRALWTASLCSPERCEALPKGPVSVLRNDASRPAAPSLMS